MTSKRWTALVVLAVSKVCCYNGYDNINYGFTGISKRVRVSGTLWIVDIYSLVLAGFIIPLSALLEQIGKNIEIFILVNM